MKTKFKLLVGLIISVIVIGSQFTGLSENVYAVENKPSLKVAILDYEPCFKESYVYNFEVAIMKELAERMGYNIDFISKDWEDLLYTVSIGEADCAIGGFSKNSTYEDMVDFTIPYFAEEVTQTYKEGTSYHYNALLVIATKKDSDLKNQLNNTIISAVEDGTVFDLAIECGIEDSTKNIVYIDDCKMEFFMNKDLLKAEIRNYMLSVEDVFFVTGNDFLVLMENGNLYLEDSIDTQTPNLIEKNIKNIVVTTDNLNHAKRIQMLCNNGDIKVAKINTSYDISNKYEYESVIVNNAKEILNTDESYSCLYISKSGTLQKYNGRNGESIKIMDNVRSCPVPRKNYLMAITNDDILYSLEYNAADSNYIPTKIMTNVKDATISLILRNNDDLYQYRNVATYYPGTPYDTPVRIGTNVGLSTDIDWFDNVSIDDFSGSIRYLTGQKECYQYSQDGTIEKISSYAKNAHYPQNNDFWRFAGNTDEFYLDFNGNLHVNNKKSSEKIYLANVKKVIAQGNLAFFITNNGELYAENKESVTSNFNAPFLTVFGQKTTKIYLNNKEVKLSTKIQERDNRTFYPFRECLEQLGATVLWDDVNKIAIGEYGNTTIEFPIGSNKYYINGVQYEMDTISYIDSGIGRTYIPIRYAAEGLGFTVDWIEGVLENTIDIYK